jgi:hypothetical protein
MHKGVVPVNEPTIALAYVVRVTGVLDIDGQETPVAVQVMITLPLPVLSPDVFVWVPEAPPL